MPTYTSTENDDIIVGSIEDDHFIASNGTDIFEGLLGTDTLDFSSLTSGLFGVTVANQALQFNHNGGQTTATGFEIIIGTDYADFLGLSDFAIFNEGLTFHMGGGDDNIRSANGDDTIYGELGNDTIDGDGGHDILDGGLGDDMVLGRFGNDLLFGGDGNDIMVGGNQDDLLHGDAGNDTLDGGSSNDVIHGGTGNDHLRGGSGDDTLEGDTGNDILLGNNGNDVMNGGEGVDILRGGDGNDVMTGGIDADQFIFTDGFGQDTIMDFDALSNSERINLSEITEITDFADLSDNHMTQSGEDVIIDDGAGNTITLVDVDMNDLDVMDFMF